MKIKLTAKEVQQKINTSWLKARVLDIIDDYNYSISAGDSLFIVIENAEVVNISYDKKADYNKNDSAEYILQNWIFE